VVVFEVLDVGESAVVSAGLDVVESEVVFAGPDAAEPDVAFVEPDVDELDELEVTGSDALFAVLSIAQAVSEGILSAIRSAPRMLMPSLGQADSRDEDSIGGC
jgi:hypothetical protein